VRERLLWANIYAAITPMQRAPSHCTAAREQCFRIVAPLAMQRTALKKTVVRSPAILGGEALQVQD